MEVSHFIPSSIIRRVILARLPEHDGVHEQVPEAETEQKHRDHGDNVNSLLGHAKNLSCSGRGPEIFKLS